MSSGTLPPPGPPSTPQAEPVRRESRAEYEQFIEAQIRKTSKQVRSVELAGALATLLAGVLAYALAVVVLDHWVLEHGLGFGGRLACFLGLVIGGGAYFGWRVVPLLIRQVNPTYAALTLERSEPTVKNSLINFLLLRSHRGELAPAIYRGIGQRAAADLTRIPVESAVDRSRLLRVGYWLLALVVIGCAYKLFSPKDPLRSFGRMLAPWSNLAPPTRVTIRDLEPGTTQVFHDDYLTVSALIRGLAAGERAEVIYSTRDGQLVDQPVAMRLPAGKYRHEAVLPAGTAGLQQSIEYYLKAGDAQSARHRVEVVRAPALLVERVEYAYPDYLGVAPRVVERQGDLQGIDGTRVRLEARSNVALRSAHVDFGCDGSRDLPLAVSGQQASVEFTLRLNSDGKAEHSSYQLRFEDVEGRLNPQPIQHRIEVVADQTPWIEWTTPIDDPVEVARNGALALGVRAADPDFALRRVELFAQRGEDTILREALLTSPQGGTFQGGLVFDAHEFELNEGDEIVYWAEASDIRLPQANVAVTAKRRLRVVSPVSEAQRKRQLAEAEQARRQAEAPLPPEQPPADGQSSTTAFERQTQTGEGSSTSEGAPGPGGREAHRQRPDAGDEAAPDASDEARPPQPQAAPRRRIDPEANPGDAFDQILEHQRETGAESPRADEPEDAQPQPPQEKPSADAQPQGNDAPPEGKKPSGGQGGKPGDDRAGQSPDDRRRERPSSSERPRPAPTGQEESEPTPQAADEQHQTTEPDRAAGANGGQEQGAGESPDPEGGAPQSGKDQPDKQPSGPSQAGRPGDQRSQDGKPSEGGQRDGHEATEPGAESGASQAEPQSANQDQSSGGGRQGADQKPEKPQPGAQQSSGRAPRDDRPTADAQPENSAGNEAPTDPAERARPEESPGKSPGAGDGQAPESDEAQGQPTSAGDQSGGDPERVNNSAGGGQADKNPMPSPSPMNPARDQTKQPDEGSTEEVDHREESSSPSGSRDESDTSGSERGNRSGQGEEGGGQRVNRDGAGAPGENQAADAGSGAADQTGAGETSDRGGDEAQVPGQSDEARRQTPGGGREGESPASQSGGQGDQPSGGSADGKSTDEHGSPAQAGPEGKPDGTQRPGRGYSADGPPSGQAPDHESSPTEQSPDEANLDYARKATDLVLDYLKDQLDRPEPDRELLNRLGWTRDDLEQFVRRWNDLKRAAEAEGDDGRQGRKRLDDALRNLGLKREGTSLSAREAAEPESQVLEDSRRSRAPAEYAEQFRAYSQGTARARTAQPAQTAP